MPNERELEDWICDHWNDTPCPPGHTTPWLGSTFMGRQVPLLHGICDILAAGDTVEIIELKATRIREKDVGQILRYAHDVFHYLRCFDGDHTSTAYRGNAYEENTIIREAFETHRESLLGPRMRPRLSLVGPSVDRKALASASGGDIEVWLWRYDRATNLFQFEPVDPTDQRLNRYPDWAIRLYSKLCQECSRIARLKERDLYSQLFYGHKRTKP